MEKIRNYIVNVVENHFAILIAAILLFVVIIAGAIILSLKMKRKNKERAEREYKEELNKISKEELDNIASNTSNPDILYKSFETQNKDAVNSVKGGDKNVDTDNFVENKIDISDTVKEVENSTAVGEKIETENDKTTNKNDGELPTQPANGDVAKTIITPVKKSSDKPTKSTATKPSASQKKSSDKPAETNDAKPSTSQKKPKATQLKTSDKQEAVTSQKTQSPHKQTYVGKWIIVKNEEDKYFAKLLASNGGVLLKTENYSSLSGVKNGIQTIKKNVDSGNFATSIDKYGRYRFKLFSMSNRLICQSEEYSSKAKCVNGINSVKRFAKTEVIISEND